MRKDSGYTFVELMVGIAILAVLSAVAIPALIGLLPGYRLRAAVESLQSDMQQARLRAVRENADVAVVFDVAGNRYTIFVDNGEGGGIAGNGVQEGGEVRLKPIVLIPDGITMYDITFGGDQFSFNGRGLPAGGFGGTVKMRTTGGKVMQIILSSVGRVRTVTGP